MISEVSKALASNLIYLRKKRNITQQGLAKISSIPRPTIANIENGSANPSLKTLLKLSHAIQTSIEELLTLKKIDVLYTPEKEVSTREFKAGSIKVSNLLQQNEKSLGFEKIEIKRGSIKKGIPHLPGTKEVFYCVEGNFSIVIEGIEFKLKKGDVLSFAGDQKHSYLNNGSKSAVGISLVVFI